MESFAVWYNSYVGRAELEKILRTKYPINFLVKNHLKAHSAPADAVVMHGQTDVAYAVTRGKLAEILLERAARHSSTAKSIYVDQMQQLGISEAAARLGLYAHAYTTHPSGMSDIVKKAPEEIRVLEAELWPAQRPMLTEVVQKMYERAKLFKS